MSSEGPCRFCGEGIHLVPGGVWVDAWTEKPHECDGFVAARAILGEDQ